MENQTSRHIRALRANNGGEFISHDFDDFFQDAGIKRELIVPYTSNQNGVAKRYNRTICEATKAMMCEQDLPTSLWGEATGVVDYIQNICPHAILEDKTLEEVFTGEKPKVDHLRIFDCPTYIHVPKKRGTKMEPSGKKGTFVSYNETSKAYHVYTLG